MKKSSLPQMIATVALLLCGPSCEQQSSRFFYKKSSFVVNDTRIEASNVRVIEDSGNAQVTYQWSGQDQKEITFRWYTENGTARSEDDYLSSSGTKTIRPDDSPTGMLTIPLVNDSTPETEEQFRLIILPTGEEAQKAVMGIVLTVTITDDDNSIITDTFVQTSSYVNIPLDILWVVDDSSSMSEDQDNLADNFSSFMDNFPIQNVDFNMAIITTTSSTNRVTNRFPLNQQKYLTDREAFIRKFQDKIKVGIRGSSNEKGFQKGHEFLTENPSWVRDNAYLIIIFVADQNEVSGGTVDQWLQNLQSHKENPDLLKIYSIVALDTHDDGRHREKGERYIQIAQQTAGFAVEIEQLFSSSLNRISQRIHQLSSSFLLSSLPIPGTVSVSVDNIPLASDQWILSLRSLVFLSGSIPTEGANIRVTYEK